MSWIKTIVDQITKPGVRNHATFEMDELCTFIGNRKNKAWIAYAVDRQTGQVVDFNIGKRTIKTLRKVVHQLLSADAQRIYTDRLVHYRSLLSRSIHCTHHRCTNKIERFNLSLRHQLKRLSRKTLCYSKSWQC